MPLSLSSPAFEAGASIPEQYTCDGADQSPPLRWSDPPEGSQSYALIVDDPDAPAGTWVHWVLYNLPGDLRTLPESTATSWVAEQGANNGLNSWGREGYGGPCPPSGTHRYFFKLYALDAQLALGSGASKEELVSAIEGHLLAQTELMGTYSR